MNDLTDVDKIFISKINDFMIARQGKSFKMVSADDYAQQQLVLEFEPTDNKLILLSARNKNDPIEEEILLRIKVNPIDLIHMLTTFVREVKKENPDSFV